MSVEVFFVGGAGNNMFKYFAGLIYAHKNNLVLKTLPPQLILNVIKVRPLLQKTETYPNYEITERDFDQNGEIRYYGQRNYEFRGYYQHSFYFNRNYDIIKQYVELYPSPAKQFESNDILCILRMGEYRHSGYNSEILHPNYFLNILSKNNFSTVYFLIYPENDPAIPGYLEHFKGYNVKCLANRSELDDFNIVSCFKNVAISSCTFNWWSAFFHADSITNLYTPKHFGFIGIGQHFRVHGPHITNLWDIRNKSKPVEHDFIDLGSNTFVGFTPSGTNNSSWNFSFEKK